MGARIEWQQRDAGSGYGHRQRIVLFDDGPEPAALVRLSEHCVSCPTCMSVDGTGTNKNLPCAVREQLSEELKEARRGPA